MTLYDSFQQYKPYFIGIDPLITTLEKMAISTAKWPPYNIRKLDRDKYLIEMAVAGFGKHDIEIELSGDVLVIRGNVSANTESDKSDYLYKGIAERSFVRQFTLADTIEVKNAELLNGMLRIWLENIIPEEKKPRKIDINVPDERL